MLCCATDCQGFKNSGMIVSKRIMVVRRCLPSCLLPQHYVARLLPSCRATVAASPTLRRTPAHTPMHMHMLITATRLHLHCRPWCKCASVSFYIIIYRLYCTARLLMNFPVAPGVTMYDNYPDRYSKSAGHCGLRFLSLSRENFSLIQTYGPAVSVCMLHGTPPADDVITRRHHATHMLIPLHTDHACVCCIVP